MLVGFAPALYYFSRNVKPMGCLAFSAAYYLAWSQGVKPFLLGRLQHGLNVIATRKADKYKINTDGAYLK